MNNTTVTVEASVLKDIYEKIDAIHSTNTGILVLQVILFMYIVLFLHVWSCKRQNLVDEIEIGGQHNGAIILEDELIRIIEFSDQGKYMFEVKKKAKKVRYNIF